MSGELERFFALKARYRSSNVLIQSIVLDQKLNELAEAAESPALRSAIRKFLADEQAKRRREQDEFLADMKRKREQGIAERMEVMERWARGEVMRSTANSVVRASAWWLTHASGNEVRAPGHASRIEMLKHGWSIEFGANHFLVGKFVRDAAAKLIEGFELARSGQILREEYWIGALYRIPRTCVANYNYDIYEDYVPQGGRLVFGAQAIDVMDAARHLLAYSGLRSYCWSDTPVSTSGA